jgi:hypothetical protein
MFYRINYKLLKLTKGIVFQRTKELNTNFKKKPELTRAINVIK